LSTDNTALTPLAASGTGQLSESSAIAELNSAIGFTSDYNAQAVQVRICLEHIDTTAWGFTNVENIPLGAICA
jgi:hypothetical protein